MIFTAFSPAVLLLVVYNGQGSRCLKRLQTAIFFLPPERRLVYSAKTAWVVLHKISQKF